MARRIEPTVFLATISPITVGLVAGTVALVRILGSGWGIAFAAGLAVWVGRIGIAKTVARRIGGLERRIDPFALREPWRFFVRDALSARTRFTDAAAAVEPGPLRERLDELAGQIEEGVVAVWEVAQRGQELTDTRRSIDTNDLDRILGSLADDDPRHRSARSQRDSHDRIAAREADTRDRLEVLDAQLDEAVVRVAELATRRDEGSLDELAREIHVVVGDLDALRLALDELGPAP